jgi:hypothetical protein
MSRNFQFGLVSGEIDGDAIKTGSAEGNEFTSLNA